MTQTHDTDDYFYKRAEIELQMAQKAHGSEAVRAHYELANLYLDRHYDTGSTDRAATAGVTTHVVGTAI